MNLNRKSKGFTLIELLIVIAIIAILAIIVVLAINPARILEKSRDSQRMSDMTSLATAINLYLADNQDLTVVLGTIYNSTDGTANGRKLNDGTGWIPLNYTLVSSGAPLAALPVDPENDASYFYRFGGNPTAKTYEIDAVFESADNATKHASDGGNNTNRYEVGTDLTVLP